MKTWASYVEELSSIMGRLSVWDASLKETGVVAGFQQLNQWLSELRTAERTAYFIGNGASASMASHFAADIFKNGGIVGHVLTDPAQLTAFANDISYEEVFAEPLLRLVKQGDMLIAISSSGNSPNIVRAIEAAKSRNGIIVTLSAMKEDNKIRRMGDLNFYVPALTYGYAESAHATVLHYWLDWIVEAYTGL